MMVNLFYTVEEEVLLEERGLEPMPDLPADRCVIFEQSRRTDDTTPLNDKGNKVFEKLTDERRKPSAEKGDQYK